MAKSNVQQIEVIQHYKELAEEYSQRSNPICDLAYWELLQKSAQGKNSILELGAGSTDLLDRLNCPHSVACDLSQDMLDKRAKTHVKRVQSAAEKLPFSSGEFEMVYSINLLEHVSDVAAVLGESARVLKPGGTFLAVTPNGNWEMLLNFAEKMGWKIPEGPHQFLDFKGLRQAVEQRFAIVEHRTFMTLPIISLTLASLIDRVVLAQHLKFGFFQYLVARKP